MRMIERCTQEITAEGWSKVGATERAFDAAEEKMGGVPKKRRYLLYYGGLTAGTMIWEREWDSMAALDDYHARSATNEAFQAASKQAQGVFANHRFELLVPFEEMVKD